MLTRNNYKPSLLNIKFEYNILNIKFEYNILNIKFSKNYSFLLNLKISKKVVRMNTGWNLYDRKLFFKKKIYFEKMETSVSANLCSSDR